MEQQIKNRFHNNILQDQHAIHYTSEAILRLSFDIFISIRLQFRIFGLRNVFYKPID